MLSQAARPGKRQAAIDAPPARAYIGPLTELFAPMAELADAPVFRHNFLPCFIHNDDGPHFPESKRLRSAEKDQRAAAIMKFATP